MVKKSEKLNRIYALGTLERIAYEVGLSQKDTCRFVDIALSLYKDTGTALWLNAGISIGIELAFWIRNNEEYVRLYKKRPEYLKHLIKVDGGITNARKRFVTAPTTKVVGIYGCYPRDCSPNLNILIAAF